MLEQLPGKFVAKHSYDMLMQDLTAQVSQAAMYRDEKSEAKAKAMGAKASAEGDLNETTSTRAADQALLDDLLATREQKASDSGSRRQLRAEELEATNKAIVIISSSAVKGNAEAHLPPWVQHKATALVPVFRTSARNGAQARAAAFLQQRSRLLQSRVHSTLAARVAEDPFEEVKKTIKDLVVRLMEEAIDEAEHKGWCDAERPINEPTRKEETEAEETFRAEIDQHEAPTAELT